MERVAKAIARDDQRFGIHPHPRKERGGIAEPPSEAGQGRAAALVYFNASISFGSPLT